MKSLAACLAFLFVGSVLGCSQDQVDTDTGTPAGVITCGVGDNGQTAPLRSAAGFTVILKMQSDDDHSKNSHQCMAEYALEITRPDGSSKSFQPLASDAEWGRPLNFRVEGFSNGGSHVLILLVEGNYPQSLAAIEFDMSSEHSVKSLNLDPSFTRRLSSNCAATLHIIGTTPAGYIVLGTETKDGCIRAERWQLAQNKTVVRDGLSAEVANNHPAHLSPHAAVAQAGGWHSCRAVIVEIPVSMMMSL